VTRRNDRVRGGKKEETDGFLCNIKKNSYRERTAPKSRNKVRD